MLVLVVGCVPTGKKKKKGGDDDTDGGRGDAGLVLPDGGFGMGGALGMGGAVAMGGTVGMGGDDGMGGVDGMGGAPGPVLCGEVDPEAQCQAAARRAGTCYSQICPENLLPPGAVRQSILANCAAPDLVSSICMIGGDCPALVEALMEGDPLLAEACGDGE